MIGDQLAVDDERSVARGLAAERRALDIRPVNAFRHRGRRRLDTLRVGLLRLGLIVIPDTRKK